MFLNEFAESKGELDVHPSVHKFEDLVRRISISSLDEAKPDSQREAPSAERNFENDYFSPSTPDYVMNSTIQTRQMPMQSLDASSPVDNMRKGVASASVLRSDEVSRDGPGTPDPKTNVVDRTPDPKSNVVEPLIVASPTQMETQRLITEKIVKEETQRREEEKERRKSLLHRKNFLDALNSEARRYEMSVAKVQRGRARKLLEEMKEHESASKRLSKLDSEIVKIAQVANGIIPPDFVKKDDGQQITKEKPHFVSDGPPELSPPFSWLEKVSCRTS